MGKKRTNRTKESIQGESLVTHRSKMSSKLQLWRVPMIGLTQKTTDADFYSLIWQTDLTLQLSFLMKRMIFLFLIKVILNHWKNVQLYPAIILVKKNEESFFIWSGHYEGWQEEVEVRWRWKEKIWFMI